MLSYLYIIFFYFLLARFGQFSFFCRYPCMNLPTIIGNHRIKMDGVSFEECEALTEKKASVHFLRQIEV